jgi:hypothetical protein
MYTPRMPGPGIRQGSAVFSDVYGQYQHGPNTTVAGSGLPGVPGRGPAAQAIADDDGNPVREGLNAAMLNQPAGALLLAVGALIVLSLLD